MKVIILAAGQGTRLRPLTDDRPKCMVEFRGKPLLQYQLETLAACGVDKKDIALVGGYLQDRLVAPGIKQFRNPLYDQTNMVETLFYARDFIQPDEDLFICYSDIIYRPEVFNTLVETTGDVVVAADLNWEALWKMRMENPLDDAETFKMDADGNVLELGKKPETAADAQAQYIGLTKVSAHKVRDFLAHYDALDRTAKYDGKDFSNMYMTSLLQGLIDSDWQLKAGLIKGGWVEVDSVEDLRVYSESELQF